MPRAKCHWVNASPLRLAFAEPHASHSALEVAPTRIRWILRYPLFPEVNKVLLQANKQAVLVGIGTYLTKVMSQNNVHDIGCQAWELKRQKLGVKGVKHTYLSSCPLTISAPYCTHAIPQQTKAHVSVTHFQEMVVSRYMRTKNKSEKNGLPSREIISPALK